MSNNTSYGNFGSSNRLRYDACAYRKNLAESTGPLVYRLYEGKFEHGGKCIFENQFWRPFDLVDVESELKNITRPNTKCPELKYLPFCEKSKACVSTFDKSIPKVIAPEVCPIIYSNIGSNTISGPGWRAPEHKMFQ